MAAVCALFSFEFTMECTWTQTEESQNCWCTVHIIVYLSWVCTLAVYSDISFFKSRRYVPFTSSELEQASENHDNPLSVGLPVPMVAVEHESLLSFMCYNLYILNVIFKSNHCRIAWICLVQFLVKQRLRDTNYCGCCTKISLYLTLSSKKFSTLWCGHFFCSVHSYYFTSNKIFIGLTYKIFVPRK